MASKGCVCVTGADSFLGSHLVKQLLNENYKVKGTLEFSESKNHLMKLPHASGNLQLCENEDLCNKSFCEQCFEGCDGVFHTASPLHTANITNVDKEVINPAKEITLNVLRACEAKGVKKVIFTSSITAAIYHEGAPAHEMFSEDDWSDVEFLKKNSKWYHLSKTVAERTAWEYADKCSFQLISILPSMMFGPMLWPQDNFTAHILTSYINGERTEISRKSTFFVDVRDVAKAHIVAFENKSAVGRIIVNSDYFSWEAICKFIMTLKPGLKMPTSVGKGEGDLVNAKQYQMSSDREQTFLNLKFRKLDDTMNDTLKSLGDFGFVESRTLTQQS